MTADLPCTRAHARGGSWDESLERERGTTIATPAEGGFEVFRNCQIPDALVDGGLNVFEGL